MLELNLLDLDRVGRHRARGPVGLGLQALQAGEACAQTRLLRCSRRWILDLPRGGLDASRLPNVDARTSSLVFSAEV